MDHLRFDALTRSLSAHASRRGLVQSLTGSSLAALVGLAVVVPDVDAKKKRRKKKKKKQPKLPAPVFNQFGCLDIGQPCRGVASLCCSGICEGLPPKKGRQDTSTCVAHNTGVCTAETEACELGVEVPCNPNAPRTNCSITTGNAPFCAAIDPDQGARPNCRSCTRDTDCQGEFGPGAACVVLGGVCTALCLATGRTACFPPAA